ncbi:MAG: DMT family transporter [Deltaproteobacteria bacterium]|nr:DMT family transporter [Deltaproteobacteria bacterium]
MPVSAAIFTALLCALFGSNVVAIKVSLTGLGAFTTAGLRFAMAAVAVSVWARVTGRKFALKPGQLRQLIIISIMFSAQLSMFYTGLNHTTASRGALIANLQPFLTLLFAHFFLPDERMTIRRVLGMSLGFIGVAILFLDQNMAAVSVLLGDVCIFTAVIIWAASAVYSKRIISGFQPFHMVVYPMIMALPVFWINAWFWDGRMFGTITPEVVGSVIYQGLVTASFGFVAWKSLLKHYGTVTLHSFLFIMPVSGVTLAGWLLGDPISAHILISLAFISVGIVVVYRVPKKKPMPLFPLSRNI